jgi:hypothetical protein
MRSQKRSDQLHYVITYRNRTTGHIYKRCVNRAPKALGERLKDSKRGTLVEEIVEINETVEDGQTCPLCKQVIKSEIIIKSKTGRPSKSK